MGPAADRVAALAPHLSDAGIRLVRLVRPYDGLCWPAATAGFFKFKAQIPDFARSLGLLPAA